MNPSAADEPMPQRPIQLTWCLTEADRTDTILQRVLHTHYRDCPRRQKVSSKCSDSLCGYFTWHLNHHTAHRPTTQSCHHCAQFEAWIAEHSRRYCQNSCGISLCSEMKKQSVISKLSDTVEGFHEYMCIRSPRLSQEPQHTHNGSMPKEDDFDQDSCYSKSGSSNPSPCSTQCFDHLHHNVEEPLPVTSQSRLVQPLCRPPSESGMPTTTKFYYKTPSNGCNSITSNVCSSVSSEGLSPFDSLGRPKHRGSNGSIDSESRDDVYGYFGSGCFDQSLPHMMPQHTSSLERHQLECRQPPSSSSGGQAENFNYDSAIASTSEGEDCSSIDSQEDCTLPNTFESASTPSTVHVHSFGNSGSSATYPMDSSDELSSHVIEERCKLADQLRRVYSEDLVMLHNRGRLIVAENPQPPSAVPATAMVDVDHDWKEGYAASFRRKKPSTLGKQYGMPVSYPEEEETIATELDHRASVKEYLQRQFYRHQTYCEHVHWRRVRKIGHGGQAKCYCIEDNANKYPLCLKEETENKTTLSEAFICLKLARLVRDAPPNIVEFFGASIVPYYNGNNLQLFLELMPGCLQDYVFENGPLSAETTLNYGYQLFEALDYLHHTLKVIHCDIKPANLLIDYNCQRLKVADFGCAELLEECRQGGKRLSENRDAGTLWYNPPEYYHRGDCSFGMDIWQAGCSVLFMITGRRPWRHLCMDVNKESPRTTQGHSAFMKKKYREMIGARSDDRHPLPGFLRDGVQSGVKQLLLGCLESTNYRLSAKDCMYLTAVSETTSPDQKSRIVKELGYAPSRDVLERLQRPAVVPQRVVDVYLGKDVFTTDLDNIPHAILNGWLGSVPYQNGMTYGKLFHLVRQCLPVTRHFGDCSIAVSENNPQAIWREEERPCQVRPDQPVDPSRAFLLYPIERTCM